MAVDLPASFSYVQLGSCNVVKKNVENYIGIVFSNS